MFKKITSIFHRDRPLSWSAISSFEYSPDQFFNKYVLGNKQVESEAMKFGKLFADSCEARKPLAPVTLLDTMEHKFEVVYNKIPLIGFADTFNKKTKKAMGEYKTGKKAWTQKRVDEWGQIDMYCLLNFITNKIDPEDMDLFLEWIPTEENGGFEIKFVEPVKVHHFKTKRTMTDILTFGMRINRTLKDMEVYINSRAIPTLQLP